MIKFLKNRFVCWGMVLGTGLGVIFTYTTFNQYNSLPGIFNLLGYYYAAFTNSFVLSIMPNGMMANPLLGYIISSFPMTLIGGLIGYTIHKIKVR